MAEAAMGTMAGRADILLVALLIDADFWLTGRADLFIILSAGTGGGRICSLTFVTGVRSTTRFWSCGGGQSTGGRVEGSLTVSFGISAVEYD